MKTFETFLSGIENPVNRCKLEEILGWVKDEFPDLGTRIAWNQPMFTHHDTFIIAFSVSKKHIAVSPEKRGMIEFRDEIEKAGYEPTEFLFRIPWGKIIDYALLKRIISFNIEDKAECKTFWRK